MPSVNWIISGILGWTVLSATAAMGDLVRLKEGGEVRGEIVSADKQSQTTAVRTRSGSLITLPDSEIDFISRRNAMVEEYVTRSRHVENTVDARLELAEWCRSQGLLDQRAEQLEQVLDLDPDHPEARKVLGYVRHLGRWMTQEDMMADRGYFRYQNRWVTRQELELLESNAAQKNAELSWNPKIRTWVSWLTGPYSERQETALKELQGIRDPEAVGALTRFMSSHRSADVRMLFVGILKQVPGLRPLPPLVEHTLSDPSEHVRAQALQVILSNHSQQAVPLLIAALRNKSNPIVCRAATALAAIGDERAVPALIDALVTTHSYQRQVATPVASGNGVQFSIGGTPEGRMFPGLLPPDVEVAARTGQLPYGVKILPSQSTPMVMRQVTISEDVKNPDVLAALEKLTGKDFGFNERDWHVWWATTKG